MSYRRLSVVLGICLFFLSMMYFRQWMENRFFTERVALLKENQRLYQEQVRLLYQYCNVCDQTRRAYKNALIRTLDNLGVYQGPARDVISISPLPVGGGHGNTDAEKIAVRIEDCDP